jgi:cell division septum initiation protein DivIVA
MSIDDLLDILDDMVDKAMKLPGGKCILDTEKVRDIIDDVRLNLPQEVRQAKAIVADRSEIIRNAKLESEAIIRTAEDKAKMLLSQEEVVRQAQEKAKDISEETQTKSREMKKAAAEFADNLMRQTEENLSIALGEVKQARQALKAPTKL